MMIQHVEMLYGVLNIITSNMAVFLFFLYTNHDRPICLNTLRCALRLALPPPSTIAFPTTAPPNYVTAFASTVGL